MRGVGNAIRTEFLYSTISLFLPPIVKQSAIVASLAMSISTLALSILSQNPIGIATASLQSVVGIIGLLELAEADRVKKLMAELGQVDQLAKRVLAIEKEQQEKIGDILAGESAEGKQLKALQATFLQVQANEQSLHAALTQAQKDLSTLKVLFTETAQSLKEVEEENVELKKKMQIAVEVQEEMILELRAAKEASIKGVAMEEKMRQNFIQAQQELQEVKEETEALTKALQLTKEENIKLQTEIGQLNSYYKEVSRQLEESKRLREQEEIMQDRLLKKLQALEQENAMLRKGSK